ncbi:lamin tail domain-containing protein [Jiulongibacter sediminis]|uniref:lamin tail domain-containing protein n=1 Tax=Jiulongibacter sediminis TaxID=1605367 RepID=UPI0026EF11A5|nr:lamin tail domain-containing protein [Jiulongibacter sediminis]
MNFKLLVKFAFFFSIALNISAQGYHSILITEIFADPTPSRGLPDKEFIELYNNSNSVVSLKGFELYYNTSQVTIPDFDLQPGAYVIATRFNNAELFEPYGDVISLCQFSLLNSGTTLTLYNADGQLVFEVTYSSDWYSPGRNQGYSLEMIDLNYACKDFENWTSSLSELGGTPGEANASANSIVDTEPPKLLSYSSEDNLVYQLIFSENINESVEDLVVVLEPGVINIAEFSIVEGNRLIIELESEISSGDSFTLTIDGVSDCIGNSADILELELSNIRKAEPGELLLSEVLFNPKSGGSDFVEIVNISDQKLSLRELGFSRKNTIGEIEEPDLIGNNIIIEPGQYLCFTEDKQAQVINYPKALESNIIEIASLSSYTNETGEVLLIDSDYKIFDSFEYHEHMHHVSIDDPDGVSLERVIQNNSAVNTFWQSASASENYATPGYGAVPANVDDRFRLVLSPEVFTPDNDGIDEGTTISINAQDGGVLDISIFDINGVLVKTISKNQYTNRFFTAQWDGSDATGENLSMGYYIVVAQYITDGDVLSQRAKILLAKAR